MAKRCKNIPLPPEYSRRHARGRKVARAFIHLFAWIGIAALYYVGFSFFFDTPVEYRMKASTAELRRQYSILAQRYDSIAAVLENVEERDRNVFRILFESDPYDLEDDSKAYWRVREQLMSKSTKGLSDNLAQRTFGLEEKLARLERTFTGMAAKLVEAGESVNNIPSIQPVINHDLTLLTASFGLRIHPFYKSLHSHMGVDYTVSEGSPVFATADGRVAEAVRRTTTSGLSVTMNHGNGYETVYNHLERINVEAGQSVKRGDIIAFSGNSGLSLAPHLHYEVRHKGLRVDPVHYFFMELTPEQYRRIQDIALSGMQSFD